MKGNISFLKYKEKILIFFLILFSLLINQYYGNKGIFPLDSFAHLTASGNISASGNIIANNGDFKGILSILGFILYM